MDTTKEEARRQMARIKHELTFPCSSEKREIGEYYIEHYHAILEDLPPLPAEPDF